MKKEMMTMICALAIWARAASACEGDESAHLCTMSCIQALEDAPPVATVQVCARDADAAKVPAQSALLLEQNCAALAFDGSGDSTLHTLECAGCEGDSCASPGGLLGGLLWDQCRGGEIAWWETLYCLLADGEAFPLSLDPVGPGFNDPTDPENIRWYCEGSTWAGNPLPMLPDVYAPVYTSGPVIGADKDFWACQEAGDHWEAMGWSWMQINFHLCRCYDYEDTIP